MAPKNVGNDSTTTLIGVDGADQKKPVERLEVGRFDKYYSIKDSRYHYRPSGKGGDKSKKFSKYVLIVRKDIDYRGIVEDVEIEIRGSYLLGALREVFEGSGAARLSESPPAVPWNVMFHARVQLEEKLQKATSEKTTGDDHDGLIFELSAAVKFINEEFAAEIKNRKTMLEDLDVTFSTWWQMVPPNELVHVENKLGEPGVYQYVSHKVRKRMDHSPYLEIEYRNIDDNGTSFGYTRPYLLEIDRWVGLKKLYDLPMFPFRYHPKRESLRSQYIARGRKWFELRGKYYYMTYTGLALSQVFRPGNIDNDWEDIPVYKKFKSRGRVVLDPRAFILYHSNSTLVPSIELALDAQRITEDELLMFSPVLYGFSLGDKKWGAFAVSRISDIKWNTEIFDQLILRPQQKNIVKKMVTAHIEATSGFDDFVAEKGLGLIGLLCGPPGVGKTLTAEAVAETLKCPLYVMTSGELGDNTQSIDETLRNTLDLAEHWKAVLLLDEADVFLSKRSDTDLVRNAVVSIFLRQLEYYGGILFLTTNRDDTIDEAFESRIHFIHRYPHLTTDTRQKIWSAFIQRASASNEIQVDIDENGIHTLAQRNINGRQIKNIMKIAQGVASQDKEPLTVEKIVDITSLLDDGLPRRANTLEDSLL